MSDAHDHNVGLIYDAAADPALWSSVMRHLVGATRAEMGIISMRSTTQAGGKAVSIGISDTDITHLMTYQADTNPMRRAAPGMPIGELLPTERIVRAKDYVGSQVYQELLRPLRLHSVLNSIIWRDDTAYCSFNLTRRSGDPVFEEDTAEAVRRLIPHIQRSVNLSLKLGLADIRLRGAEAALHQLPHGVILVDRQGHAVFLNREADAVLAAADGLSLTRQGLAAARTADSTQLASCLARAMEPGGQGAALRLERPSGRRPLSLLIVPLRLESEWMRIASPMAMVVVTDLERGHVPPAERLRRLYGLSPAEAAIAIALTSGMRLNEIAEQRGITSQTARFQLRQILAKTGVSRQTELVQVLQREALAAL